MKPGNRDSETNLGQVQSQGKFWGLKDEGKAAYTDPRQVGPRVAPGTTAAGEPHLLHTSLRSDNNTPVTSSLGTAATQIQDSQVNQNFR